MRPLEASQAALVASTGLQVVTLVKLTTYTDRLLNTIQTTRYFSDHSCSYKWASGALQTFEPWLISMAFGRNTMDHLPSADGSALENTLRRTVAIVLRNWLQETGAYLYAALRAETLEFARVEIGCLFIGPGQSFSDLSNLSGSELTWLYRGQVVRVGTVTSDSITIECESELPTIKWLVETPAAGDPEDSGGRRAPIVLGDCQHVELLPWNVGAVTLLSAGINSSVTTIGLEDATAFPATGTARIGIEEITWTGNSGTQLTGCTRGANGTSAQAHDTGQAIMVLQDSDWIASSAPISSLVTLYAYNPVYDVLAKIPAFGWSAANVDLVDGSTVSSVSLTLAQVRSTLLMISPTNVVRLKLYADILGPAIPYDIAPGYSFDEGTGWNTSNLTQANDTTIKTEGASAQKFSYAPTIGYSTLYTLDSQASQFSLHQGSGTVSDEATIVHDGAGSMELHASNNAMFRATDPFTATDYTGKFVRFWYYAKSSIGQIHWIWLALGDGTDYALWRAPEITVYDTWIQVTIDLSTAPGNTYGSFSIASVKGLGFRIVSKTTSGGTIFFDNIELSTGTAAVCIAQRTTTSGTVDLTTEGNIYRVALRHNATEPVTLTLCVSNATGSGTTKPSARWQGVKSTSGIPVDTWTDVDMTMTALGGAATPNNVETISVEISGAVSCDIWLDDLRVTTSATTEYLGASGALIEHMPDILRYVLTQLCEPPALISSDWNTTAADAAADGPEGLVHGLDLATLGETSLDALARCAFEDRASLFSVERSEGTVYKLTMATHNDAAPFWTWPAPTRTLTQWQTIREDGRDSHTIFTRFPLAFSWRSDRGDGLDAYAYSFYYDYGYASKYGTRLAATVLYRTMNGVDWQPHLRTVSSIQAYYAWELSRIAASWRLSGVPWREAFDLEKGDIITLTPPWLGSAQNARIVEKLERADFFADLVLVAVSTA